MAKMFGGLTIAEQKGLTSMPQKAASAWIAVEGGIVGAGYKPLVFVGTQVVKGTNYHFIAEQTLITAEPIRHIVKVIVYVFNDEFKLVPHSIEKIF
ncbi:MAG: hypothetical protein IJQ16_00575 [Selenomonadaceae bacterium]|nr:hypothetical protein [Selenomonadaceae bacterium]